MTTIREADTFLAQLLGAVAERFHAPTDEFLTVRCIARPALIRALGEIRDRLNVNGSRQTSGTQLLKLLRQSGVAHQVPITGQRPNIPADRLYAIGLGADPDQLDPIEILQAHCPDGIVCYFSAIHVHGLSTQLPTHHHIATRALATTGSKDVLQRAATASSGKAPSLGSPDFYFQNVPYFTASRDAQYLQEAQQRFLNDKSRFRVTTLEQTLLDSLHRPRACGGPAVVFEVWTEGARRLDADKLEKLLAGIDDPRLTRRAGYMLDQQREFQPGESLRARLGEIRSHEENGPPIPLFAGVPYTSLDQSWRLLVP